ncbi:hypothetical protein C4K37_2037 [Pseudomonas chlororaphis subsp. piscium]|nr:hypothetical protein C4K37_2037 [Pseudomonas chlororaphis subsp. piscium]AZC42979.1 hypothetical protein C4K36_2044 [Pseudomonas chlororaphis subsp. piscium]AZC49622.1 hypothetical protein C4K35_2029 [Pseudomonas chlororaphis subsp. piscium]AZC56202.1 hypothetical protein C4K34_2027 [Pseudomonas chlororaphis subsp. piscium]AZC62462.1 hypothetical protein C4K33_1960 [Pseudomonas chlororaphis subsp. piscium]
MTDESGKNLCCRFVSAGGGWRSGLLAGPTRPSTPKLRLRERSLPC